VIKLHLLSALLAGMLVYELVHIGASVLERPRRQPAREADHGRPASPWRW
jgi:hypothetical protein